MASFIATQQMLVVEGGDYNHDGNHINWPTLESLMENTQTDNNNTSIDLSQVLTSDERIPSEDEDWPQEEFPGITRFPKAEPSGSLQIDGNDFALINSLANLAPGALMDEMRTMHTIACELADEEAHERARGKILRVLLD